MQRPIVGSAVSGIRDLVKEGQTGLLVMPGDPEGLAHALERLLEDRGLSSRLGQEARRAFLESYGEERMLKDIESLYEELLQEKQMPLNWLRGPIRPEKAEQTAPAINSINRIEEELEYEQRKIFSGIDR